MANSSVSNIMKTVNNEKLKENDMKKLIQRERDNLQYGNSLAVKTYQIDNNFLNLKTNLKLLDSNFDIWNFHKKSNINYISPICRLFEMLVNGKMQQKIPVFFSCLLKAFQLSNSIPPRVNNQHKASLNIANNTNREIGTKARNTTANTIGKEKMELFKKLHHLFNLNKITKNIVKLLMMHNSGSQIKKEISNY